MAAVAVAAVADVRLALVITPIHLFYWGALGFTGGAPVHFSD